MESSPTPNQTRHLETLPNEIWLLIFQETDYIAIRFASVSKNFNNLVFQNITNLSLIYTHYLAGINPGTVNIDDQMIQKFVNLRELSYTSSHTCYEAYLFRNPLMSENDRSTMSFTDIGLKSLTNLTFLDLTKQESITDEGIKDLTKLQVLKLDTNFLITNLGIKNLTNLTSLDLSLHLNYLQCVNKNKSAITDEGLLGMTKLRYLNLSQSDNITNILQILQVLYLRLMRILHLKESRI